MVKKGGFGEVEGHCFQDAMKKKNGQSVKYLGMMDLEKLTHKERGFLPFRARIGGTLVTKLTLSAAISPGGGSFEVSLLCYEDHRLSSSSCEVLQQWDHLPGRSRN